MPPKFALVPSPLVGEATFVPFRDELRRRGFPAELTAGRVVEQGVTWELWAESVAEQATQAGATVLVGHSGAGPGMDLVAERAPSVRAVVYLDATLLEAGERLRDGIPALTWSSEENREARRHAVLANPWRDTRLWEFVEVTPAEAAALAEQARDLPLSWYEQELPAASTGAGHAYIAFVPNHFYEGALDTARERRWGVREVPGKHFHFLVEPAQVADVLLEVLRELGVDA